MLVRAAAHKLKQIRPRGPEKKEARPPKSFGGLFTTACLLKMRRFRKTQTGGKKGADEITSLRRLQRGASRPSKGICAPTAANTMIARRSSLSARVAMRQLAERSTAAGSKGQAPTPVSGPELSSFDLSLAPPERFRKIAAATRVVEAEKVPCGATRDPLNPALQAAQAKDAALLSKVLEDVMAKAAGNWQIELTTVKYGQALPEGQAFQLDTGYLAALALARGSSMSHA